MFLLSVFSSFDVIYLSEDLCNRLASLRLVQEKCLLIFLSDMMREEATDEQFALS